MDIRRSMLHARGYRLQFVDQSDGVMGMASHLQLGDAIASLANGVVNWGSPHAWYGTLLRHDSLSFSEVQTLRKSVSGFAVEVCHEFLHVVNSDC